MTITANDDKTLFFPAQAFTVAADWTFVIDDPTIDPTTGGLYEWDGTDWQPSDAAAPDTVTRYGHFTKGDYVGLHVFVELYNAIRAIKYTAKGVDVSSRADDAVPENNEKQAGGTSECGP
ncbi:MAG TPA: hypothetical protein VF669_08755 [Tepidisphaeraceae bacterium]